MRGFDWQGLMRRGLVELRLGPAEFWALTPVEFLVLTGLDGSAPAPLSRARLMELAAVYPDGKGRDHG